MRLHRVYVKELKTEVRLTPEEAAHMRVLRLQVGDKIVAFDGAGFEAEGIVQSQNETTTILHLKAATAQNNEPPINITLAVALLKADKLSDVVRACTELGVGTIQLLVTEFSSAKEIGGQKLLRLQRIAGEAAKQSRRTVVPNVLAPVQLKNLAIPENTVCLVAHPGANKKIQEVISESKNVLLLTGPEGGFSEGEMVLLKNKAVFTVGLGPRILRAETAAVVMVATVAATENF